MSELGVRVIFKESATWLMNRIPNIFHFVFGLKEQTEPFHLCYFLCLTSCLKVNQPENIYFYYHYEPHGRYWDLIKEQLELVKVDLNELVNNYQYPFRSRVNKQYSYAHQSDFVRMEKLIEHGGVYGDIDTLFIKPIPETLFKQAFVLGREKSLVIEGETKDSLCNALIMSEKGSIFAKEWLKRMPEHFDGTWSNHSTLLPEKLSQEMPEHIHVEASELFYDFMWTVEDLESLFEDQKPCSENAVSLHLWNHLWWSPGRTDFSNYNKELLNENHIRNINTSFNLLARPYLPPEEKSKARCEISVIIPTRNRPKLLRQAILSVLNQSHVPKEILVYDDASDEPYKSELEAIRNLSDRIKVEYETEPSGPATLRNKGMLAAQGDLLHFLDDDGLVKPGFYEVAALSLEKNADIDVLRVNSRYFKDSLPYTMPGHLSTFNSSFFKSNALDSIFQDPMPIHACLVRKSAIKDVLFNSSLDVGEDTLFWLELASKRCKFDFIDDVYAYVRLQQSNSQKKRSHLLKHSEYLTHLLADSRFNQRKDLFVIYLQQIRNDFILYKKLNPSLFVKLFKTPLSLTCFLGRFCKRKICEHINLFRLKWAL